MWNGEQIVQQNRYWDSDYGIFLPVYHLFETSTWVSLIWVIRSANLHEREEKKAKLIQAAPPWYWRSKTTINKIREENHPPTPILLQKLIKLKQKYGEQIQKINEQATPREGPQQ